MQGQEAEATRAAAAARALAELMPDDEEMAEASARAGNTPSSSVSIFPADHNADGPLFGDDARPSPTRAATQFRAQLESAAMGTAQPAQAGVSGAQLPSIVEEQSAMMVEPTDAADGGEGDRPPPQKVRRDEPADGGGGSDDASGAGERQGGGATSSKTVEEQVGDDALLASFLSGEDFDSEFEFALSQQSADSLLGTEDDEMIPGVMFLKKGQIYGYPDDERQQELRKANVNSIVRGFFEQSAATLGLNEPTFPERSFEYTFTTTAGVDKVGIMFIASRTFMSTHFQNGPTDYSFDSKQSRMVSGRPTPFAPPSGDKPPDFYHTRAEAAPQECINALTTMVGFEAGVQSDNVETITALIDINNDGMLPSSELIGSTTIVPLLGSGPANAAWLEMVYGWIISIVRLTAEQGIFYDRSGEHLAAISETLSPGSEKAREQTIKNDAMKAAKKVYTFSKPNTDHIRVMQAEKPDGKRAPRYDGLAQYSIASHLKVTIICTRQNQHDPLPDLPAWLHLPIGRAKTAGEDGKFPLVFSQRPVHVLYLQSRSPAAHRCGMNGNDEHGKPLPGCRGLKDKYRGIWTSHQHMPTCARSLQHERPTRRSSTPAPSMTAAGLANVGASRPQDPVMAERYDHLFRELSVAHRIMRQTVKMGSFLPKHTLPCGRAAARAAILQHETFTTTPTKMAQCICPADMECPNVPCAPFHAITAEINTNGPRDGLPRHAPALMLNTVAMYVGKAARNALETPTSSHVAYGGLKHGRQEIVLNPVHCLKSPFDFDPRPTVAERFKEAYVKYIMNPVADIQAIANQFGLSLSTRGKRLVADRAQSDMESTWETQRSLQALRGLAAHTPVHISCTTCINQLPCEAQVICTLINPKTSQSTLPIWLQDGDTSVPSNASNTAGAPVASEPTRFARRSLAPDALTHARTMAQLHPTTPSVGPEAQQEWQQVGRGKGSGKGDGKGSGKGTGKGSGKGSGKGAAPVALPPPPSDAYQAGVKRKTATNHRFPAGMEQWADADPQGYGFASALPQSAPSQSAESSASSAPPSMAPNEIPLAGMTSASGPAVGSSTQGTTSAEYGGEYKDNRPNAHGKE